jgi:mRNA interferase MazF
MEVAQWEVWLSNLDPVIGSEQGKTRPVLVISATSLNNKLPVVNVIPVTSRKPGRRIYPNETLIPMNTAGLPSESIALCYQVRTLDKRRLIKIYGSISESSLQLQIFSSLKFQLGMNV